MYICIKLSRQRLRFETLAHGTRAMSDKGGDEAPPAQGYAPPAQGSTTLQYPTADIPVAGYPTAYPNGNCGFHPRQNLLIGPHTPDLGIYDGRIFAPESQQYTSNLFDCTDDMETCCYGTFCTVCQVGESAQRAKAGDCCATTWCLIGLAQLNHFLPFLGSILAGGFLANTANRAAINYGVTEHTDLVTACFCAPCGSCRLAREVKAREGMGVQPVDVLGQMRGTMLFPTAPVMVRTSPRDPGAMSLDGVGGADTMVTYVAVTQPRPDYHRPLHRAPLSQAAEGFPSTAKL